MTSSVLGDPCGSNSAFTVHQNSKHVFTSTHPSVLGKRPSLGWTELLFMPSARHLRAKYSMLQPAAWAHSLPTLSCLRYWFSGTMGSLFFFFNLSLLLFIMLDLAHCSILSSYFGFSNMCPPTQLQSHPDIMSCSICPAQRPYQEEVRHRPCLSPLTAWSFFPADGLMRTAQCRATF